MVKSINHHRSPTTNQQKRSHKIINICNCIIIITPKVPESGYSDRALPLKLTIPYVEEQMMILFIFKVLVFLLMTNVSVGKEAVVDPSGGVEDESRRSVLDVDLKIVKNLLQNAGETEISEQALVNIASVIESAKSDPETSLLLLRMKDGRGKTDFDSFKAGMSPRDIVVNLKDALNEMEMAEILFRDPVRAVKEMEKEGLIPDNRLKQYKKKPELLADDTRKQLYFTFCSLAAAGGYL